MTMFNDLNGRCSMHIDLKWSSSNRLQRKAIKMKFILTEINRLSSLTGLSIQFTEVPESYSFEVSI